MNKKLLQQALECFEEIILHNDQHVFTANKGAELLCAAIAQTEQQAVNDAGIDALNRALEGFTQPATSAKADQTYTGDDLAMAYKDGYAAGGVSMAQGDAKDAPLPQINPRLIEVLRGGRQCDEEGSEIIMSRQACWEAAAILEFIAAIANKKATLCQT